MALCWWASKPLPAVQGRAPADPGWFRPQRLSRPTSDRHPNQHSRAGVHTRGVLHHRCLCRQPRRGQLQVPRTHCRCLQVLADDHEHTRCSLLSPPAQQRSRCLVQPGQQSHRRPGGSDAPEPHQRLHRRQSHRSEDHTPTHLPYQVVWQLCCFYILESPLSRLLPPTAGNTLSSREYCPA